MQLGRGIQIARALREQLPDDLARVLATGWRFDEEGALLLRSVTVVAPRPADLDLTGWEAFQTHVHIPQGDLDHVDADWAKRLWSRSFAFASQGLRSAVGELNDLDCLAIVGLGSWQDGATVRFHLDRGSPGWVTEDLELYETEAIAVLSSAEVVESIADEP